MSWRDHGVDVAGQASLLGLSNAASRVGCIAEVLL